MAPNGLLPREEDLFSFPLVPNSPPVDLVNVFERSLGCALWRGLVTILFTLGFTWSRGEGVPTFRKICS